MWGIFDTAFENLSQKVCHFLLRLLKLTPKSNVFTSVCRTSHLHSITLAHEKVCTPADSQSLKHVDRNEVEGGS